MNNQNGSFLFQQLEYIENFINNAPENEIMESINYLLTQTQLILKELEKNPDPNLGARLETVLSIIMVYLAKLEQGGSFEKNNYCSIAAIAKDEGAYLGEWIEYHRIAGIDKFYLYDNGSSDNTVEILAPYVKKGIVTHIPFPGEGRQLHAYMDAAQRFSRESEWLAFIDIDEFLVPLSTETIADFLRKLPMGVNQLLVDWRLFNSSGHIKKPEGLVIENYKMRTSGSNHFKCIVRTTAFYGLDIGIANSHYFLGVAGRTVNEHLMNIEDLAHYLYSDARTPEKIALHHYLIKSKDEFCLRRTRPKSNDGLYRVSEESSVEALFEKWENEHRFDILDKTMDKYAERVKKALKANYL